MSEALSLLKQAHEAFRSCGRSFEGFILTAMAEAHLRADQLEEAQAIAERVLDWARERGERGWEPLACHVLGLVAARRAPPDVAAAKGYLESALSPTATSKAEAEVTNLGE